MQRWKKNVSQNRRFCQNIPTPFWASFSQNLNFSNFCKHTIGLVSCAVTVYLLCQKSRLFESFRYPALVRKVHRKFSRSLWKKFQLTIWWRNKAQIRGWNFLTKSRILSSKMFQMPLKTFCGLWEHFWGIGYVLLTCTVPPVKQIVTIRHTNQIIC